MVHQAVTLQQVIKERRTSFAEEEKQHWEKVGKGPTAATAAWQVIPPSPHFITLVKLGVFMHDNSNKVYLLQDGRRVVKVMVALTMKMMK